MKEYVEKGAALEATYAPFTMSMCMTVPECNGMNRARKMIFKQLRDIPAADVVPGRDFRDCRNELCLRCGEYKMRHKGACDGCRWRDA